MNQDDYARGGHPRSRPVPHHWGDPVPGSGRMRICRKCGAKELSTSITVDHPDYSCSGLDPVAHPLTETEYEPI
jgi:hypothetical protein